MPLASIVVPLNTNESIFSQLLSVPNDLQDPEVSEDSYRQSLKTFLFAQY